MHEYFIGLNDVRSLPLGGAGRTKWPLLTAFFLSFFLTLVVTFLVVPVDFRYVVKQIQYHGTVAPVFLKYFLKYYYYVTFEWHNEHLNISEATQYQGDSVTSVFACW